MSAFAKAPTGPAGPGPTGPAGPGPTGPAGPGPTSPSPTSGTGAPWPSRPGGPSAPGGPTGPGRLAPPAPSYAGHQIPARRDPGSQVPSSAAVARTGGPGFTLPQPSGPPAFGTLPDGSPPFPGSPPTPPPQPQPGLSWLPALMLPALYLVGAIAYAAWAVGA